MLSSRRHVGGLWEEKSRDSCRSEEEEDVMSRSWLYQAHRSSADRLARLGCKRMRQRKITLTDRLET
jgi:hypothetical protein